MAVPVICRPPPCSGLRRPRRTPWRLQAASSSIQDVQLDGYTLTVHQGRLPEPIAVSKLLARAFAASAGEDGDEGGASPLAGAALVPFQLKLLAALQWRGSTLGRSFIAVAATEAGSQELAGVANVSAGMALADADTHQLELGPGQAAATISNMAVAERHRRRGLGRRLLAACEHAAQHLLAPPATLCALTVYSSNEAAIALYESSGYQIESSWVDPRWAESAERGRVAFGRRQLMVKRTLGVEEAAAAAEEAAGAARLL